MRQPMIPLDDLLECAIDAASSGGKALADRFEGERHVEHKGAIDLVTDADRAAEAAALAAIRARFPDHAILAEEEGASGAARWRWIVDPLDGTTNYAHRIPHVCTSVACELDGELVAAAIVDPLRNECFSAAKGRGAFLNGRRLHVTTTGELTQALLATGFPYSVHQRADEVLALFGAFLRRAQGLRRYGSAALDLAWVAAGRYDGFFEMELKPWDIAAGILIVREAGGVVTDLGGGPVDLTKGDILAANPALHPALVPVAAEAIGRAER